MVARSWFSCQSICCLTIPCSEMLDRALAGVNLKSAVSIMDFKGREPTRVLDIGTGVRIHPSILIFSGKLEICLPFFGVFREPHV